MDLCRRCHKEYLDYRVSCVKSHTKNRIKILKNSQNMIKPIFLTDLLIVIKTDRNGHDSKFHEYMNMV